MKILTEGHSYQLDNFEKEGKSKTINFIHKVPDKEGYTELKTLNNGTTNEEVLRVLINRMEYLQNKFPCRENAIVIDNLKSSLDWLERRTANRMARGVE